MNPNELDHIKQVLTDGLDFNNENWAIAFYEEAKKSCDIERHGSIIKARQLDDIELLVLLFDTFVAGQRSALDEVQHRIIKYI